MQKVILVLAVMMSLVFSASLGFAQYSGGSGYPDNTPIPMAQPPAVSMPSSQAPMPYTVNGPQGQTYFVNEMPNIGTTTVTGPNGQTWFINK